MVENHSVKELTVYSIGIGIVLGIVMTAANVYLGLYAGMTVSASIPAAVISMGIFKGLLKRDSILESNIVQTMASAGESLAAGIIFTLPALVIVGAWNDFDFWLTTGIAISGGLLGVVFMIPLRKTLIVEDKDLIYPEGVACASVLRAGSAEEGKKGFATIGLGLAVGAIFKFFSSGLHLFTGSVEWATKLGKSSMFFGLDISPALVAVGYIVKLDVALLVFLGGAVGWFIGIPLLGTPLGMEDKPALDVAWHLWSTQIRYIGVGAMIVGGMWSIVSVRKGIVSGLKELSSSYSDGKSCEVRREDRDLSIRTLGILFLFALLLMFVLYDTMLHHWTITFFTTLIMFVASFLFVAVSSYIVGLVGSSNNPVSGMTISALLATSVFFLVMGYHGESAILATLGVAAVVCCAACTAGDCSQDLKTGYLVGATPRSQQIAQIIGVIVPAVVIAPVLTLLHQAYGIGVGLKAPQATLFASITKALFGDGQLPYIMIVIGVVGGVIIIIGDRILERRKSKVRLHLMPVAVGIYLPVTLGVPMVIGGLLRYFADRRRTATISETSDQGILISSGLIAGEALMGVGVAVLLYMKIDVSVSGISHAVVEMLSLSGLALVTLLIWNKIKK